MKRILLEEEGLVHVISRVVQKRWLMDEAGMEAFRHIMYSQAAFAGVHVVTYCFLSNHFHILLHIDPVTAKDEVSDEELVSRFRSLYGGKRSVSLGCDADSLKELLHANDERAAPVRAQLLARMGSLPVFMRELKTRFTRWYNEQTPSVGTFWAERYRSVWIEPGSTVARTVAAYIDLNPVRAGLTKDPLTYRFCGAGEAAHSPHRAREAYRWLAPRAGNPAAFLDRYMEFVRAQCPLSQTQSAQQSPPAPPSALLRKSRAFTKGGVIGSQGWVRAMYRRAGIGALRSLSAPPAFSP